MIGFYSNGGGGIPVSALNAALGLNRLVAWDTFDRPDGPLGISDSGHAWSVLSGDWGITAGEAFLESGAGVGLAALDSGSSDVDCQARIEYYNDVKAGWAFRIIDASNYLRAMQRSSTQGILIQKVVAGSSTTLATVAAGISGSELIAGDHFTLRFRIVGSRIDAWRNGVWAGGHTLIGGDESTFASGTQAALLANGGSARGFSEVAVFTP